MHAEMPEGCELTGEPDRAEEPHAFAYLDFPAPQILGRLKLNPLTPGQEVPSFLTYPNLRRPMDGWSPSHTYPVFSDPGLALLQLVALDYSLPITLTSGPFLGAW